MGAALSESCCLPIPILTQTVRQDRSAAPAPAEVPFVEEDDYDLTDPKAFARFLQDADIGLIRLEYLVHLLLSKRTLPRRQEAQGENFTKDGETRSALVSHEELQRWSEGTQAALICSISHAWETREHPDPCGHQLQQVRDHCGLFGAAFEADVWIFYDYTSLFQFERIEKSHEMSFRRSMNNMHLLYAHEYSLTFRIQNLTREDAWNEMMGNDSEMVQVWVPAKGLESKPLKALVANRTPYGERGWCKAEIEWSSLRSVNAQFQQIDAPSISPLLFQYSARLPKTPEDFRRQMEQAAFTHRSDASAVISLQEKIFIQKVTNCEDLFLVGLAATEMLALAQALPHYTKLRSLRIRKFRCSEAEAKALAEALAKNQVEQLEIGGGDHLESKNRPVSESGLIMVKALGQAGGMPRLSSIDLSDNALGVEEAKALVDMLKASKSLRDIDLSGNNIQDRGAQALAEGLKACTSLRDVNLAFNRIGAEGVKALSEVFQGKLSLRDINLSRNLISDEGAQALLKAVKESAYLRLSLRKMDLSGMAISAEIEKAIDRITSRNKQIQTEAREEAKVGCRKPFETPFRLKGLAGMLEANRSVTEIYLHGDDMGPAGVKALAEALKANRTITEIDLSNNNIGDAGAEALAEALNANRTITGIVLSNNNIGDAGAEALAEALKANRTVRRIRFQNNNIGDAGAKALAEALKANRTITEIDFSENNIGDAGAKVLAAALYSNRSVKEIDLSHNHIGDAGAEALAKALKANRAVTEISLYDNDISNAGYKAFYEVKRERQMVGSYRPASA